MSVIGSNILAGASGQQGYNISRSVRLRSSASAYFNRTFSTPTDAKKWTFNRWVKRGSLGARQSLFSAGSSGTSYAHIEFKSDDTIQILSENSATQFQLVTTQVFRDPSAWYNLHIIYDCANATSSDRLQLWINGVRVTAFSTATYPSTTPNNLFNTAIAHQIGVFGNGFIAYFDGYQTELNFIDGQALIPSSFGEINTITGVWQPKKYTGTYGTNGFYLNFSDNSAATAAAIGKDGIFIVIHSLDRLQFNILEHQYVPEHIVLTETEQAEVLKKYNITDTKQMPSISRYDPVALAIG